MRDRAPDGVEPLGVGEFVRRCDALVSIGGDGTMLGALRLVADAPRPGPPRTTTRPAGR